MRNAENTRQVARLGVSPSMLRKLARREARNVENLRNAGLIAAAETAAERVAIMMMATVEGR